MADIDWVFVYFMAPCLLFKSTRVAALVLLLVFPFYSLAKFCVEPGTARYWFFGAQDALVCVVFLWFAGRNKTYKMEDLIALLSASAVIYHFLALVAYKNGINREFYGNACMMIVIMQIAMLYTRIVLNGRIFRSVYKRIVFRVTDIVDYCGGGELSKKTQTIKRGCEK